MSRYIPIDKPIDLNYISLSTKHARYRRHRNLYYAPIYNVYLDTENPNVYHFLLENGKVLIVSNKNRVLITYYNVNNKQVKRYIRDDDKSSPKYIKLINNIKNFNRNVPME